MSIYSVNAWLCSSMGMLDYVLLQELNGDLVLILLWMLSLDSFFGKY